MAGVTAIKIVVNNGDGPDFEQTFSQNLQENKESGKKRLLSITQEFITTIKLKQ